MGKPNASSHAIASTWLSNRIESLRITQNFTSKNDPENAERSVSLASESN